MFPQRLKECRKARGLSLRELASVFNMNYTTFSKYESGTRQPTPGLILGLARYFGVTTDYLLGASPDPGGQLLAVQYDPSLPEPAVAELESYIAYLKSKYCKG